MKLKPDLIRDILLVVEDNTTIDRGVLSDLMYQKLNQYDTKAIDYHIRQAELSGLFFEKVQYFYDGGFYIVDLSPDGHKFINEVRNDTTWTKTKDIAASFGNFSLDALKQIAASVAADFLARGIFPH